MQQKLPPWQSVLQTTRAGLCWFCIFLKWAHSGKPQLLAAIHLQGRFPHGIVCEAAVNPAAKKERDPNNVMQRDLRIVLLEALANLGKQTWEKGGLSALELLQ